MTITQECAPICLGMTNPKWWNGGFKCIRYLLSLSLLPITLINSEFCHLQEGTFTTQCLREFWKMVVPPNFCPVPGHNCMESLYDEAQVVREMIQPLEQFLCGSSTGDPNKIWEELSKNDNPPALCGRVFRMGEPTYRFFHSKILFLFIDLSFFNDPVVEIVELILPASSAPIVSAIRSTNSIDTS